MYTNCNATAAAITGYKKHNAQQIYCNLTGRMHTLRMRNICSKAGKIFSLRGAGETTTKIIQLVSF